MQTNCLSSSINTLRLKMNRADTRPSGGFEILTMHCVFPLFQTHRLRHWIAANYNQDITTLESCLNSLRTWFCENGITLYPAKSVAILFGTSQKLKSFSSLNSCNVAGTDIQLSDKLKILGATLDLSLIHI